jgi:hypothetical protein
LLAPLEVNDETILKTAGMTDVEHRILAIFDDGSYCRAVAARR